MDRRIDLSSLLKSQSVLVRYCSDEIWLLIVGASSTSCSGTNTPVPEELVELVPGLVWAVVAPGAEEPTRGENLRPPTQPPRSQMALTEEASLVETLLILALIHLLFEHGRVGR